MKKIVVFVITAGFILLILCLIDTQIREWTLAWTFNAVSYFDSTLAITTKVKPLVIWPFVFGFWGLCFGLYRATIKLKLNRGLIVVGILLFASFSYIMAMVSKPQSISSSQELGETIIFNRINETNSQSLIENYLDRFPSGEYVLEVKNKLESIIWDSANINKSPDIWTYYINRFPESSRVNTAKRNHEDLLYELASSSNTVSSYKNYLNVYPNGRHSRKASQAMQSIMDSQTRTSQASDSEPMPDYSDITDQHYIDRIDFPDGRYYEGSILGNQPDGSGREYFPDGSSLEGTWVNGKREGTFTFHHADESTEIQVFSEGNRIQ